DGKLAAADRGMHLLHRLLRQAGEALLQLFVAVLLLDAAEGRDQKTPAELGILAAHRIPGGAANGRARLARHRNALPRGRRRLALGDQHLNLVAVPELRRERKLASVDGGAYAPVAHIRVHRVGEVDGRRTPRQGNQATLWRKAEYLVLEQLELRVLQKLF